MANLINQATTKVTSNVIGSVAGGALGWWASGKYLGVQKTWVKVGIALVGVIAGAYVQSNIKARSSAPKGKDVK
jgi:hypothetical protein